MTTFTNRNFGIEIECIAPPNASNGGRELLANALNARGVRSQSESYNHTTRSHWKITTDASLPHNGLEVVSPILSGQAGLDTLKIVLETLNGMGYTVNRSCGIHVHQDAPEFDAGAMRRICQMYLKYENLIDKLMAPSRRGQSSRWCKGHGQRFASFEQGMSQLKNADTMNRIRSAFTGGDRYHKLNLESYTRYGTVEFRQHGGSLDFKKISAWIYLTQGMMNEAARATYVNNHGRENMNALLANTPCKETRKFLRQRVRALA
ncbi:MAG: amidoligase family protein [bacterium]